MVYIVVFDEPIASPKLKVYPITLSASAVRSGVMKITARYFAKSGTFRAQMRKITIYTFYTFYKTIKRILNADIATERYRRRKAVLYRKARDSAV